MKKYFLNSNWKMRRVNDDNYIDAEVPGSVFGDLLAVGKMEDPFWKDNEDKALRHMDYDYEYLTYFECDEELLNLSETLLVFEGLDTIADIFLNGKHLAHTENMHRCWKFPVKGFLHVGLNELKVILYSPVKYIDEAFKKAPTLGTEDAMNGFVHIRKAHYMFGWDWGAHLPDAGIWRPVYLLGVDRVCIESVNVLQYHEGGRVRLELSVETRKFKDGANYEITAATTRGYDSLRSGMAQINPELTAASPDMSIIPEYEISDPEGNVISSGICGRSIIINKPKLWWPNGFGRQDLYKVDVFLIDENGNELDRWSRRIGLRSLTMDTSPDKWGEKFAVRINGVNIFSMGADYIPEDHLTGRVNRERTKKLLEKAVFANFNTIRVWGGGYYPDDDFFDLCDEMGLIVWQDFMFACGVYDLTPKFKANIAAELVDNIKRIRHHACIGVMCGNNEMEDFVKQGNWVSKDSEVRDYITMYEIMMPKLMNKFAPQICYRPSSPSSGGFFDDPQDENRGDVHYWQVWHGNKPFSEYRKYYFRYLSEFGFQSFPAEKTVETFTDDDADKNIFSYIMEKHQRNGSANGKIMNYMQQTYKYPNGFDTLIYASQLLQADAIRYGVEHFRRNRNEDRCMGTVYWQFNDCWPVASWSSVDYCHRLKALHYYARRFFAPIMISCEEEGMLGSGQELVRLPFEFKKSIRLNVTNETLADEIVTVKWQLRNAAAKILREETEEVIVPALSSVWLDRIELPEVDIYSEYVSYAAYKDGQEISSGSVIFSYPKYFRYEDPELSCSIDGNKITVTAAKYAKSVEILNENEDIILTDNYFDLNGDSKTVEVLSGAIDCIRIRSVYDIR